MEESYQVWIGDKLVPIAINTNTKEAVGTITHKFDTCQHRSETEVDITVQTCCSTMVKRGWRCLKKNIDFLGPTVCVHCELYQPKETPKAP